MFDYQDKKIFFAQVTGKMEEFAAEEISELGAKNITPAYKGLYFHAEIKDIYRIVYNSRIISRVLAPLTSFYCVNAKSLTKEAMKISWEDIFSPEKTFAITASVANSKITNSLYASQCLKDGIADYFREKTGKRPNVETDNPDVRINLYIFEDRAVISLDLSGESLHKRGYRLLAGEAPMQETLAAAIIRISGWNGENPLWDCMCGSGTILCEALMHYCRIPAQYLRKKFGFFNLQEYNAEEWESLKSQYDSKIRPLPSGLIFGSDKSGEAVKTSRDNLSRLPFSDSVKISKLFFQEKEKFENGTIITNPPFAIRIGKIEDVKELYSDIGDFLKQKCTGTNAFIYMGDTSLRKSIGLKTSRRIHIDNGKLEGVLVKIESYSGSKKKFYDDEKPE